jgi:hypothetical protein
MTITEPTAGAREPSIARNGLMAEAAAAEAPG